MATKVHLDSKGLLKALEQRGIKTAVDEMAERVAERVRSYGITVGDKDGGSHEIDLPVTIDSYKSDRPRASVFLAHAAGLAVQAKHGALTRAAADLGLEVQATLWYTTKAGVTRRASQAQIDNWTGGR